MASLLRFQPNCPKLLLAPTGRFGQALGAKNANHSFGRLIDPARAEPVAAAKHGRSMIFLLSVEEFKRLKSLESPESRPEREERE